MAALTQRAQAMLERVELEARTVVGDIRAREVRTSLATALACRDRFIRDDHDPRYLHPARTIRILIADAGSSNGAQLAAAAFVDSVDTELAGGGSALSDEAAAIARDTPLPRATDDDTLLERIVTAVPLAAEIALAERLDHARHLHLRDDLDWPSFHSGIRRDYIPAARFLAPGLARRFERWADAFERRLLMRG